MRTQMVRDRTYPVLGPVKEVYLDLRTRNPAQLNDLVWHKRCHITIYRECGALCSKQRGDSCLACVNRRVDGALAKHVVKRLASPMCDQTLLRGDTRLDTCNQTLPYQERLVSRVAFRDSHVRLFLADALSVLRSNPLSPS
jgi:hypothetical protein